MQHRARSAIEIRAIGLDEWQEWRAQRLAALEEAPHAFCSTLAEWQGEGDTEQHWRARLSSVPLNALAFIDGAPAGMVSATAPDATGTTELISMWVAPFARGRGVSDALIAAVIAWARTQPSARITLEVFAHNEPAIALYRRHGFTTTSLESIPASDNEIKTMSLNIAN
jgi:ribosomal protein S18 acetylase RimI-like enzyme